MAQTLQINLKIRGGPFSASGEEVGWVISNLMTLSDAGWVVVFNFLELSDGG